ncbi:Cell division protein FtsA [hydrothermal vent metagenome]|uniref:Cell division protein FtsA n=1 Tax=hydrothermal vent metagenome TaxID=652676 RepID=A0A3B1CD48_9ZZZZ|nr:cell division protein FtsA [Candidatus Manganitrophaceae bacterium]
MAKGEDILVGLDVGTTKICAIVAEVIDDKRIDIIGIGTHPSVGLKKGMVINIESTVKSIKRAVEEAELMAGVDIGSIYTGIAGGHIKGFNSSGVVAVKDQEVSQSDIDRVMDAAKAISIPDDQKILHVLPQEFVIDQQDGIKEPLGMSGVRLEVIVHIITGAVTAAQNIEKSIQRGGLDMIEMILQPIASSEAVLTPEEKELGVAVVDIGGGTTDIATFVDGGVRHTAVIPIGGTHFTNDIAIGLRTPRADAEKIKIQYGCASVDLLDENEVIEVPSVGGRPPRQLSRQLLSEIIEPRAEEIFSLVAQELEKMGDQDRVASGVVITGGTSSFKGMIEVAERVLGLPVRLGVPTEVGGLVDVVNTPGFSTGVGLTLYAFRSRTKKEVQRRGKQKMFQRMRNWVKGFF